MIKRVLSKLRKVTMSLFAVLCVGAVWAEEGEVTTPEVTPEPEPTPSTSALALDPSAGYILTGLGELGDQAAVVFTNSAAAVNWTVPKNLKDVEILVVGGGGGGGGHYYSSTAKNCQGGAGGGAGAVVTGFIKDLAADQVVNVTVGAGGAGGAATTSATTGAGKGGNGGNSVLKVGNVTYVTAYGGGGDGGYNSAGVANGGSNSGVRETKTAANLKSVTVVGEGAENLVTDIVARANKGGGGYTTSSGYPGAGGGGAMSEGGASGGSSIGGICGYGYVSMITGTRTVYGAGGGGGIGKNGGTGTYLEEEFMPFIEGAGLGVAGQPGSDALANQGAGGGGGSWKQKGGNGGSGIVVLRFAYSDVDIPVDATANILPKISDKAYTGEVLVSGLENTYAYTVEELGERINFGQQTVRVTLNDGYVWADGDTNKSKDFTWNITQEANNWKVEPYLSHTAWPQNFASSVNFKFTAPETSFGVLQAELSANGAAPQSFSGTLPTEPGSYTLKYWVEETANWAAKEWTVNFKIYRSEAFAEGYKVYGLGENGDEVAVVFTQNASWTVPANLKSAQFLVVGGGGGGGADPHYDAASGGAGGGGGGVVTGEVDLTKAATVAVTIGAGGAGGKLSTDQKDGASSGYYYGGSKKGGNSVLKVDGTTYVTAYGGGRDQGVTKKNSSSITTANMREGGQGGSNGGSRGGITAAQSKNPTMGAVASNAALRNCTTYGNKGGKGCSDYFYGYPSAGGGGGATEAGGDAGSDAAGWAGGKGGEGLASDITGARLVYGSGGGGASTQGSLGGIGGSGAGNGGDRSERTSYGQGTSALANQGGGGGGSSREITYGGAGGSGIVVIRYTVYPAEVNDVPYASFAEAFAAAQDGDTVNIYQDVKLSEILVINKAITLDGNGCTLTSTAARAINVSGVDGVTIKNLTISTSGERAINVIQGATNVTIENVTATAYNYTVNIASSAANAVVAINNSTLNGLCTVNVAAAGAKVTIDDSTVNCNDNNTTAGESYAALCLGKEAVGASIVATNTVVNVTEGSDSVKARNGAENGTITIDGSTDNVTEIVAVISYAGQASYYSFFTLEDAIDWATDADTITILKDIATDAAFEITKKVAINLNGKTIATTQADTEGNGVFWVKAGGVLTLNGEGTVNGVGGNAYNIAIWADGGKVIINGGTYTNEGAQDDGPDGAHFDLIYVKNGGAVEINGGTFKCQTPEWTLNSHDTKKGTIVVNGGLFYQFNPSDCATEGAGTNWCAEGLKGAESAENAGYYEIVDAWTAPMPEKDGEADITEEYTSDVLAALEAAVATSVDVKVNGVELKGNEAVKALNTAVKCFDGALTFDGTAASVDIVIEVTEVNTEDPAASTVVVKRGDTVLSVKTGVKPTVKYIDLGSDAVVFKLVFE